MQAFMLKKVQKGVTKANNVNAKVQRSRSKSENRDPIQPWGNTDFEPQSVIHSHVKDLPKHIRGMSLWAVTYTLISILLYVFDFAKDILYWNINHNFGRDENNFGSQIIFFIIFFSLILTNIISIFLYARNGLGSISNESESYSMLICIRVVSHCLLLGNIYRAIETSIVGFYAHERVYFDSKARWNLIFVNLIISPTKSLMKFLTQIEKRMTTSSIYLFEAVLRTWPIITINLAYLILEENSLYSQTLTCSRNCIIKISLSLASIAFLSINIVSFNECHHELRRHQKRWTKLLGIGCQFVWRFATITARIFAMMLGIFSYTGVALALIVEHWFIITLIMLLRDRARQVEKGGKEHETSIKHLLILIYDLLRGIPRVLFYLKPSVIFDERIKIYYFFMGMEDLIFLLLYYVKCRWTLLPGSKVEVIPLPMLLIPSIFFYLVTYSVGIGAMNLYYHLFKAKVVGPVIPQTRSEYALDILGEKDKDEIETPTYGESFEDLPSIFLG